MSEKVAGFEEHLTVGLRDMQQAVDDHSSTLVGVMVEVRADMRKLLQMAATLLEGQADLGRRLDSIEGHEDDMEINQVQGNPTGDLEHRPTKRVRVNY